MPRSPLPFRVVQGLVVLVVAIGIGRSWAPDTGFTHLIGFSANRHTTELPRVRETPHAHGLRQGYDGEFYAQIAIDPWLRDPALDLALDHPAYRARRMLFSWTAYVAGLGRPRWILQAYALQNVAAWLLLAWLLQRWIPIDGVPRLALWTGSVLTAGLLASVRFALTDAPGAVLVALSVGAVESRRTGLAAGLIGLATFGRETCVVAAGALLAQARTIRSLARLSFTVGLALLPFVAWLAYLAVRYGASVSDGAGNIGLPLQGLAWKLTDVATEVARHGLDAFTISSLTALLALAGQSAVIVGALRRGDRSPWTLTGAAFLAFTLVTREAVWAGAPGAFTRVGLPMAFAANVILARRPNTRWWQIVVVNLGVIAGLLTLFDVLPSPYRS